MSEGDAGEALLTGEPPSGGDRRASPSPFVGLRPYTAAEAFLFFGRERERRVVSANLVASRLTLLYGPSGVGKSSILNAAAVPHLRAMAAEGEADNGKPDFVVVAFNSWRDEPVEGLIESVAVAGRQLAGPGADAADTSAPLVAALRAWHERVGTDLLVILDQFEEYFLYHGGRAGDDRFAREFPEAVNDPTLRVNFLVSFREDALARLDLFKGRIPRLFSNYLRVGHLDAAGARQAIEGPVAQHNRAHPDHPIEVEPALVDDVLEQVEAGKVLVGQTGAGTVDVASSTNSARAIETSHLQVVMARLWDEEVRSGSHVLRRVTLHRLGGAAEIVRNHLDRQLEALSEREEGIVAAAFEHLVTPSGTKIAHSAADLAILARVPEPELRQVLGRLSAGTSRILRSVEPAPGRTEERYEIFHDVLAPAILDWRGRYVQQQERAQAEEELRRQRREAEERARAARRRARNVSIFSVVSALLVVAVVVALATWRERERARSRQQAADALAYLSVDPARSVERALAALDIAHTPEAETALRRAVAGSHIRSVLTGHRDWVNSVAFDPTGRRLVTASSDKTARIWDVDQGRQPVVLEGHEHWVATAAFDPSGGMVATASADGTARLWDAGAGRALRMLRSPTGERAQLVTAGFDPAGNAVVGAGADGIVRIWDVGGNLVHELRGHSALVTSASFDASGSRVVTSSWDGTARVWHAGTGQELARLERHDDRVERAVFAPDGTLVATVGRDGDAYLWRWQTGEGVVLEGHTDDVMDAEFDRSGRRLVTAGDKTARVWEAGTGQLVATFRGHSDRVMAAVFSGDGRRVATASQDGSARVWDVATATALVELRGHPEIVWDVAFSPTNDRLLATAGSDGTARLWELPEQLTLEHPDWVLAAEFSPDGSQVLTSGDDGNVRVWDARTGAQEAVLGGHGGRVLASFDPRGELVVTVDDHRARIWDRRGGERPLAETEAVRHGIARFLPPGDTVVASNEDGSVYVWDWRAGGPVRRLTGFRGFVTVTDLQLSSDGRRIVTATSDRVARIWDVATGAERGTLRGHTGVVYSARFSSDGRFMVTSSADGSARIWDASSGEQIRSMVADRGLRTAAFDSTGERVVAGGVDGSIRIWDADSGRVLSVLARHTETVNSAVFGADGRLILSASDDWTAAIYECRTCVALPALRREAERLVRAAEPGEQIVTGWALAPGDCYDALGAYAKIVDCDTAHEREVFAVTEHPASPEGPFDEQQVNDYARRYCEAKAFEDYVGVAHAESRYRVGWWTPNGAAWEAGDRRIACALHDRGKRVGSARGTER